jgi:preprotein translocase subunit SecA
MSFVHLPFEMLRLRRFRKFVGQIAAREEALLALTDAEISRKSAELRYRARAGATPSSLIVDAFSLMRETCRRIVGLRHYDVQLTAGAALCERSIVEMQTGEGKTLTAGLPLYVFGLYGKGAYLATSNDYLAARDADWLRPAFQLLGLTVGTVTTQTAPSLRKAAYRCDITYGTGKEFGFDFLRDRLAIRAAQESPGRREANAKDEESLQRAPYFMLVDEADSVLLDDACTPLIISAAPQEVSPVTAARFQTACEQAPRFEDETHYRYDERKKQVELTIEGRALVRSYPYPAATQGVPWTTLYEDVERAILARRNYRRDRQYVVAKGEVHIVDEFTGRIAEGRKWRDGLHQAIEAQENLTITDDGGQAARVTVQDFFLRFPKLAGMTGTAASAANEFRRIYKSPTVVVPTNKPARRKQLATKVFGTAEEKWTAIVEEIQELHERGQPVLVGTRSIDRSEVLSHLLRQAGLEHTVLNAREIAREADIVAAAGERGRITVATNMAGRGTDIILGGSPKVLAWRRLSTQYKTEAAVPPEVMKDALAAAARDLDSERVAIAELGGLHVILTEMHEAARIDRQFIGRGARQGDPGTFRIYLALDDELIAEGLGLRAGARYRERGRRGGRVGGYAGVFRRAQRAVERRLFQVRRTLLYHEHQRHKIYREMGLDPYVDLTD